MPRKLRVDPTAGRESNKDRVHCAGAIGSLAPQCALYQNNAPIKDAADAVVQAGVDLDGAEKELAKAEALVVALRAVRDGKVTSYDLAHARLVSNVEMFAASNEEIQSIGLAPFERGSHQLATPNRVTARYDANTGLIYIYVERGPGRHSCIVEVTSNLSDPTSWRRLDSLGAETTINGYPPGVYWIRAATANAGGRSAFTDPVAVTVR